MYLFRFAAVLLVFMLGLKLYSTLPLKAANNTVSTQQEVNNNDYKKGLDEQTAEVVEEISPGELQALMHLAERSRELKKFEDELNNKQLLIEATRDHIEQKIIKLQELQQQITKLVEAYHQEEEVRILSWVKIYENMRPQDAAQIFDDLDVKTLLPVIDRMKESKVSALLAKMRPEKARQITTKLTSDQDDLDPKKYNLCLCE